jgi:hypothetical protein
MAEHRVAALLIVCWYGACTRSEPSGGPLWCGARQYRPSGWIRIGAQLPKSERLWPLLLSPQQAAYVATHSAVTNEQLFENHLPPDWPYPKMRFRNRLQGWRSESDPGRWFEVDTVVQRLSSTNRALARFFVPTEADGSWVTSEEAFSMSVEIVCPPEGVWPPSQIIDGAIRLATETKYLPFSQCGGPWSRQKKYVGYAFSRKNCKTAIYSRHQYIKLFVQPAGPTPIL